VDHRGDVGVPGPRTWKQIGGDLAGVEPNGVESTGGEAHETGSKGQASLRRRDPLAARTLRRRFG
jgi:hypothetical protein